MNVNTTLIHGYRVCSVKILRVLVFVNFADWPRSAKISSRSKKKKKKKLKRRKYLTPFIKNSAFNGLVPLGRYELDLNIMR